MLRGAREAETHTHRGHCGGDVGVEMECLVGTLDTSSGRIDRLSW